jgi:hypothetical protein
LILNMFIYKLFYEKNIIKNLQDFILVQMYEIVKIQIHFQSYYLIFLLNLFHRCVDLGKIFKNETYFFSFGQSMKIIIIIKVEYFCMQQRVILR